MIFIFHIFLCFFCVFVIFSFSRNKSLYLSFLFFKVLKIFFNFVKSNNFVWFLPRIIFIKREIERFFTQKKGKKKVKKDKNVKKTIKRQQKDNKKK